MAILHTVSNLQSHIKPESEFASLLQTLKSQETAERIKTIESSTLIDDSHQSVAGKGQSEVIAAEDPVELHFVAFVKSEVDSHLYELDGSRKGPIDHGLLDQDQDMLSQQALNVVKNFIDVAKDGDNLNFSLCALSEL